MKPSPTNTARNLSLYLAAQGLQVAVPLVTVPVFTRFVSPEEYGVLDMLQIVMILGLGLGNWGLSNAFDRFFFAFAGSRDRQARLLRTLVTFTSLVFLAVFAAVFGLRGWLTERLAGSDAWSGLLLIILATGFLNHLNSFFFAFFRNSEAAGSFVACDAAMLGVTTALGLVLVAAGGYGIWGIVLGSLVGRGLLFTVFFFRFGLHRLQVDGGMLKECLAYGWPLMAHVLPGLLNNVASKFMVGAIVSLGALGVYGRADGIAAMVFMIMTTVQHVYAPRWNKVLFGLEAGGARALAALFTDYVSLVIVPACGLVLFGWEAIRLLMPEPYHGAVPLVIGLALHYQALAFGKLLGSIGAYLSMSRYMGAMALAANAANIALNLVLIPRLGALGAVLSTVTLGVGTTLITGVVYGRRYAVPYEAGKLARLYGGLVLCGAAGLACYYEALPYAQGLVLRVMVGLGFLALWLSVVGVHRVRALWESLRRPVAPASPVEESQA